MIASTRFVKLSGLILMTMAACVTAAAFFLPYLLDVNAYRDDILAALTKSLNRPVTFEHGSFAWHFGPTFEFSNVSVQEPDSPTLFISAKKVTVQLALVPLLEKRVEFKNLQLTEPAISLIRRADGTLNIDDLLKPGTDAVPIQFKGVRVTRGTVQWRDLTFPNRPISATITKISLAMDHLTRGKKGHIKLSADILPVSGASTHISVSGSIRLPPVGTSLVTSEMKYDADIKQAEIGRFWPYFGRYIPFVNPGGRLDFATSFSGTLSEFKSSGKIAVTGAAVTWPTVFHATLAPRSVQIDYTLTMNERLIDISAIDARTDGFRIKGSFQLFDYRSHDPRIVARASTPATFRYEDIRTFIPYGIIEKDAADYVENKIKSGIFKLDTGILDGRISQITHMEVGQNYNTLTIRGPVEQGVLSYGNKSPTFNTLKGTLELKGKNFNLIGMSGSFGTSPFTLDGSIVEYNTDKPSDYPVRMDIAPRGPEIAWLAKLAGIPRLEYSSSSNLKLTGSGHHTAYRLSGEWDLRQAAYALPDVIRKPLDRPNNLSFKALLGTAETRITALTYSLQPLSLSGNALFTYAAKPYLGIDLQTNRFLMSEALPLLPSWRQYHPHGILKAAVQGSGNPSNFSSMEYNGTITMSGFTITPGTRTKLLSGINGTIKLRGNSLETSSIAARYGSSPITFSATVKNLQAPEARLRISSPQLFLRDFGLVATPADTSISRFSATGRVKKGSYAIDSISGMLNESNFHISGVYHTGQTDKADLTITSTKLDLDNLLLFSAQQQSADTSPGSEVDLKLKLNIASGNYGRLPFRALKADLQKENGTIYLQNLKADIVGGKMTAKGRIAPGYGQGDRYDLALDLVRGDAEKLFSLLDISRDVTGKVTLQGTLTARGNNLVALKKSALGNVRLQMNDGSLHKFSTLSKVFSILNVSQLLKFQLPDMVSGGMPYNTIKGSFAIKDGIISSQDLFINSDAINISIVGSADIVREELNLTLGVQPLQTVDKIINRIPIVGWLLTGKDKDLLTAYFEAKGSWAHPQVSAIPVKSMGKGVLNIFRRVFELPVRLFTDTGEVILGQ